MNCLICKTDISDPAQQFGDVKHPICQSDYLAGFGWVYENGDIVKWLESGISLQEACELVSYSLSRELDNDFMEFMKAIDDMVVEVASAGQVPKEHFNPVTSLTNQGKQL